MTSFHIVPLDNDSFKLLFNDPNPREIIKSQQEYDELLNYFTVNYPQYLFTFPKENFHYINAEKYQELRDSSGFRQFLSSKLHLINENRSLKRSLSLFYRTQEIDEHFTVEEANNKEFKTILSKIITMNSKMNAVQTFMSMQLSILGIKKEYTTIDSDFLKQQLDLSTKIQAALNYRFLCLENYDEQCKLTSKKIYKIEKLRQQTRINEEQVNQVMEELKETKIQEQEAKELFYGVSNVLKREIKDQYAYRDHLLEKVLDGYVMDQIKLLS